MAMAPSSPSAALVRVVLLLLLWSSRCACDLATLESTQTCSIPPCVGPSQAIFCRGSILTARWEVALNYNDSAVVKFEGMELAGSPNETLSQFESLLGNQTAVRDFIELDLFLNKSGVKSHEPSDWVPSPSSLDVISNETFRNFSLHIHKMWPNLSKIIADDVLNRPDLYSIQWVPKPFIVPGGRFGNYFYWDSYFVMKGLIFSEMLTTARGILENFIYAIDKKGFVPNCGLLPCARRSQPPLLTWMFDLYYNAINDTSFLEKNVGFLSKEITFWEQNRSVLVGDGQFFYYNATSTCPRPEEYLNDIETADSSTNDPPFVFRNLNSGAESGLDFSSKWLTWEGERAMLLPEIVTNHIIPVELNVIMCRNYKLIASFYDVLGEDAKSAEYKLKYSSLQAGIEKLLWNETDGIWYDYNMVSKRHRDRFFPTNVMPLFGCSANVSSKVGRVADYWKRSGVMQYPGGVPASLNDTGQQWDFPNLWAPLTDFVVDSFVFTGDPTLKRYAMDLVGKFLEVTLNGWIHSGFLFEKYNVTATDGHPGGGGEYKVQQGFGWTNGVVLDFLKKYGNNLHVVSSENEVDAETPPTTPPLIPTTVTETATEITNNSVSQEESQGATILATADKEKEVARVSSGVQVVAVAAGAAVLVAVGFAVVHFFKRRSEQRSVPEYQLLLGDDQAL